MEQPNVQASQSSENLVKEIVYPIYQAKIWMQLLGVVMIIQGILTALTIFGIVIAWLPIWLGVLLFKAAGSADSAMFSGQKFQLLESLRNIKTYFVINGVLMLLMVVFIGFVFFLGGMAALMEM